MNLSSGPAERLSYLARRPAPPLGAFVECLWLASGVSQSERYRVLPNGAIELIINLGDDRHGVVEPSPAGTVATFSASWIAGLQLGSITIESRARTDLLGVRFLPGGAAPFLCLSLADLTDQVVDAQAVLTRDASPLRECLLAAATPAARFDVIEAWLTARLADASVEPAVAFVCVRLRSARGQVRIGDLIARTGWSHRRLLARFRDTVGTTPKALARVFRLQRALELASCGGDVDWSLVAAASGFSDQAHFNHEFRGFTGLTPTQYVATRVLEDRNHARVDLTGC